MLMSDTQLYLCRGEGYYNNCRYIHSVYNISGTFHTVVSSQLRLFEIELDKLVSICSVQYLRRKAIIIFGINGVNAT